MGKLLNLSVPLPLIWIGGLLFAFLKWVLAMKGDNVSQRPDIDQLFPMCDVVLWRDFHMGLGRTG